MDDAQRMRAAPAQAFEWVAQELIGSDAFACQALQAVWLEHANDPQKLIRELRKIWSTGVHWPSGEAYARTLGWLPEQERAKGFKYRGDDPPALLAHRLMHVAHRIYRDPQVRALIDPASPTKWGRCTHVCINQDHFDDEERNVCGIRQGALLSIQAGLLFMREPAHKHPACDCTIDPYPVKAMEHTNQ